jgi:lysozyme
MSDRQSLVDLLIRDEGVRLKPYVDTIGKITIGCGRNLTDVGISYAEAMLLLDDDIDAAVRDLAGFPWFPPLDDVRQRVIVSMRFQMGAVGFRKFKATIAAVESGDYVKAAEQMLRSKWAREQAPLRARRLARMMATGVDG